MIYYGFIVLLIAGLCQGSYGLGYKKYPPFSWAVFWGVYNIMCMLSATLFVVISAPKFVEIYASQGFSYFVVPLLCGAAWGLSSIGFSKGITMVGMSLVYGISMGISTIVGSITPMLMGDGLTSSALFWCGLALTLVGVVIVTIAGIKRDGGVKGSMLGIGLSIFSGVGSGFMNVGFAHSDSISSVIEQYGYTQMAASAIKWLPVLVGGGIACVIYCIGEVSAKKEWHTLTAKGSKSRVLKLFGISIIWYSALMLYGYSTYLLGDMGSTIGWILFNALALIISVLWGLKTGEWKNAKKTTLFIGCGVLILAWILIAMV